MARYPRPLKPGDRIGVTAPVERGRAAHRPRVEACVTSLRTGFDVVVGWCLDGTPTSLRPGGTGSRAHRDARRPQIRAVFPPWGGETAIDLLDLLDWDALAAVEPTWVVGFSDRPRPGSCH